MEHQSPLSPDLFLHTVIYRYLLEGISEPKNYKSFTCYHSTKPKISNTFNKHQEIPRSRNTLYIVKYVKQRQEVSLVFCGFLKCSNLEPRA